MEHSMTSYNSPFEPLTLKVQDCAELLGIGRSAAYNLVRTAEANGGIPFRVMRIGTSILISRKSFNEYLESNGLC